MVNGRIAGFYDDRKRGREDEEDDDNELVVMEDVNGVYEVERVVEMKKKKVSVVCNQLKSFQIGHN